MKRRSSRLATASSSRATRAISRQTTEKLTAEISGIEGAGTLEENLLAFLDTRNEDDKLLFLEAVYSELVASGNAKPPSKKLYKAVYLCLQQSQSLEMAMRSYRLLTKDLGNDGSFLLDCVDIGALAKGLAGDREDLSVSFLARVLSFQYIVEALQTDFNRLQDVCCDNWELLEDSQIAKQLKGPPKRCSELFENLIKVISEQPNVLDKHRCSDILVSSAQALIALIFDLDESLKRGGLQDLLLFKAMDVALDKLHYQQDALAPFLDTMQNPEQKLHLILRYFSKHISKAAAKSIHEPFDTTHLGKLLQYVKDNGKLKAINENVLQLLLAQAFQAFLHIAPLEDSSSVAAVSSLFVTAFAILFPDHSSVTELESAAKKALIVAKALSF